MHYQILPLWFLQVQIFFPVFNSSKIHIYLARKNVLILVSTILFYPIFKPPQMHIYLVKQCSIVKFDPILWFESI
jgi:hypothetical protein